MISKVVREIWTSFVTKKQHQSVTMTKLKWIYMKSKYIEFAESMRE